MDMKHYNKKLDDLLEETLGEEFEADELLEQRAIKKLEQAAMGEGAFHSDDVKNKRFKFRPVVAGVCALVLIGICTASTTVANGMDMGKIFYMAIWGEPEKETEVPDVISKMEIVSEENTFEDIAITPLKVMSDGLVSYMMIKVKGINGFQLEKDMGLARIYFENAKGGSVWESNYVLKWEENAMYVVLKAVFAEDNFWDSEIFQLRIYDMHHVEYDKFGRVLKIKHRYREDAKEEDYTGLTYAALGHYLAEIKCSVLNERVTIEEGDTKFLISEMGVYISAPESIRKELISSYAFPQEERCIKIIRKDGSEIDTDFCTGTYPAESSGEPCLEQYINNEPVELSQVAGIRVLDKIYYKED